VGFAFVLLLIASKEVKEFFTTDFCVRVWFLSGIRLFFLAQKKATQSRLIE